MLRKAWYAVLSSEELLDKPVKVSVHENDFLLLQDPDGVPHAFNAYCPHRGCDLSLGTISNGELICPFHGWRFNEGGHCTHIPANRTGAAIPPGAHLTVYPVCDEASLTWIYTFPESKMENVCDVKVFPECKSGIGRMFLSKPPGMPILAGLLKVYSIYPTCRLSIRKPQEVTSAQL